VRQNSCFCVWRPRHYTAVIRKRDLCNISNKRFFIYDSMLYVCIAYFSSSCIFFSEL